MEEEDGSTSIFSADALALLPLRGQWESSDTLASDILQDPSLRRACVYIFHNPSTSSPSLNLATTPEHRGSENGICFFKFPSRTLQPIHHRRDIQKTVLWPPVSFIAVYVVDKSRPPGLEILYVFNISRSCSGDHFVAVDRRAWAKNRFILKCVKFM